MVDFISTALKVEAILKESKSSKMVIVMRENKPKMLTKLKQTIFMPRKRLRKYDKSDKKKEPKQNIRSGWKACLLDAR